MMKYEGPLNACTSHKIEAILNRVYTFLHFINISSIIYYRLSTLKDNNHHHLPLLPWLLLFSSEVFLSFYSLISLAFGWRHITWTAFPDRLPEDEALPAIDVFIFTSDPGREPPWNVANTVVSAMSLDYPKDKISVYLSDDGGSPLTLQAIKEGVEFAKWWVPYCRKYKIKTSCPKAYFGNHNNHDYDYGVIFDVAEYLAARKELEEKYMEFQKRLQIAQEKARHDLNGLTASRDHSPVIQVINKYSKDDQSAEVNLPSLIYVAREKRPNHPHHFKAGAINALLRVSGIISNSPYILVLDSDMYSNDPSSARQSMCFHLDPNLSTSLAFVQFPQKFHNINLSNDIYDGQIRSVFQVKWPRMGGLEGPILSGTCFYIKREALYGAIIHQREYDLPQLKQYYGLSNEFIKSLQQSNSYRVKQGELTSTQLSEAKFLASTTFEQNTKWGDMVGFMYASVVEDYMTGFSMQCRGWKSVFYNPERPAFLGTATINLNDAFIQTTRWHTGFVDVAFSRFFPLFYGPLVNNLSLLQSMCYAYFAIQPLCCFPFWCLAIVPQLCLLLGFPLYPKATSPWFMVFSFAFLSRLLKNLADVLITGSTRKTWWNEERFWMMRGVTSSLYGSIDSTLKKVGLRESSFTTTNKVDDNERIELYNKGMFDFRTSTKFIIPLVSLVIFNLASFIAGVLRAFILDQWSEFLGQILLSFFVILLGYPIIEGMVLRTDDASISASVSLKSGLFAIGLFVTGSVFLHV